MKDKILTLCRRLKNFTREEILSYLEIEENILDRGLLFLIEEGCIDEHKGVYSYVKSSTAQNNIKVQNKNLHLMFQYHSPETIDLIVKLFCLKIPSQKADYLVNLSQACVANFYKKFRELIYNKQSEILLNHFFEEPQQARYRLFFNKYAYFYVYNNQVFVSEKCLQETDCKGFSKAEIQLFKKVYCYLSRILTHNMNEGLLISNLKNQRV